MKAAILYKDLDIRIEEIEKPEIGSDEILIRVRATGICGSDLPRVLKGTARYYPIILGHEFSGEIAALGSEVEDFCIGDKVTAAPLIPCHQCEDCQKGNHSQCKNYSFIGSRKPGTWAEYVVVPARNTVKLHDKVSFIEGAFVEPITVALHALNIMGFRPSKNVAIIGMGTIGLLTLQCVKNMGAGSISVFDIDDEKIGKAKIMGADFGYNPISKIFWEEVDAQTDKRGYDIVLDCAGSSPTVRLSLKLAANKGQIMYIGTPTTDVTLTPEGFEMINRKELTIQASWMSYSAPYPGIEWKIAADYLAKRKIDVKDLIYKTIKLDDVKKAFEEINQNGNMPGKIIMEV